MSDANDNPPAPRRDNSLVYFSFGCGLVAWALILLNFITPLGRNYLQIFWFLPVAILGSVTGLVACFGKGSKTMAVLAMGISLIPILLLLGGIVSLLRDFGGSPDP